MPQRTGALVGREADLSRLHDAIGLGTTSRAGSGGVVVLSGDAGIGKSRLVGRVCADAEAAGWTTAVGHCVGLAGAALPYLPFVELLGSLDAADPGVVESVLATHPSLGHLLPGHSGARSAAESSTDTAAPGQVAEAVHAVLTAFGAQRPLLAVVEDVHWADHSSRDLITLLLTRGFPSAVGLVVTYRSDDLHRRHPLHDTLAVWARIAGAEHVELSPLPDDAVRQIVAGIEGAPSDAATAAEITRRAEGNPFFAEELAASAAAGQSLTGGLGRVLRSRVEQLDDTAQRVLRAVALKGGHYIGHELLSRVTGLPDDTLEAALAAAVEHHVIETRWPPAYTFRHALLGETVADGLLPGERLRLHHAFAAALAEHPDLAPASELARHAAAAGDLATAVRASRDAGEAALAVGGPQDALLHFEQALGWLDEDDPERDELTLRASDAAMIAGEPVRAVELLRDRLDHPGSRQRPDARADLLAMVVVRGRILDLPLDALPMTREAVRLIGDEPDERRVRVLIAHLQALVDAGSFVEAAAVADEVSLLAERLGHQRAHAEVRTILARVIEARDDLDAVERHLRAVVADIADDDPLLLRALNQLASVIHRRGDLAGSLAVYDDGAAVARRMHRQWAPWGQECRLIGGLVSYELGDWDGALSRLDLGATPPQPGRTIFTGARLLVQVGRGERVDPAVLAELREWWPVDGLCVVMTVMPGVELLAQDGDLAGALEHARAATAGLDRVWGEYHAVVRLAALVAGVAASGYSGADRDLRARLADVVGDLVERARSTVGPRPLEAAASLPKFERAGTDDLAETHRETWAWLVRAEAEHLRLRRLSDLDDPPTADELVEAWRRSVEAFDRYGHVFEAARSRARLAHALHLAGDDAAARTAADDARAVARRLGAQPLLDELDAVFTSGGAVSGGPGGRGAAGRNGHAAAAGELTPRELEVLGLLARGLTNGQIGRQLYISTKTVSVHVSNLLAKLGASGRTEAAAIARDRGLVD